MSQLSPRKVVRVNEVTGSFEPGGTNADAEPGFVNSA